MKNYFFLSTFLYLILTMQVNSKISNPFKKIGNGFKSVGNSIAKGVTNTANTVA